ncbi:hypothetical protein GCM10022403_006630 [Streptomyces coacervatus]|uniref:Uncharacterized protein n=1 Tax=Streptomyces coacervatus TaxID=647381 RepID=A0ABP7GWW6_9ACTN
MQWEVEALEPDELQRLVLAAVDPYVDRDGLAEQIAREEQQRRALADFLSGLDAASGTAPWLRPERGPSPAAWPSPGSEGQDGIRRLSRCTPSAPQSCGAGAP